MGGHRFLAFDIGAESGRAVVGTLDGDRLALEEIHRFPNGPVTVHGTMFWDALGIHRNVLQGMGICARRFGGEVDAVGIDTWGLDFGLLGDDGQLLQNPVCYRDRRTDGMLEEALKILPADTLYDETGVALVPIYTLYQMLSLRRMHSSFLASARQFLMMPDLLNYFLTGERCCERSNAVSTQLYNPRARNWSDTLFRVFDLPRAIMPALVDPGTSIGGLSEGVKTETGLTRAVVVAPCTHDTPSAVTAVPGGREEWAFISSGTWSTVGALNPEVVPAARVDVRSVLNELAIGGFFLCRNIMGMWLLQRARAEWQRAGHDYSYEELVGLAEKAPANGPLVNPDDRAFMAPEDMCRAIRDYCMKTGQRPPEGPGEHARCILESLALSHMHGLRELARILGRSFAVLHIVGGGSRNRLLCQLTANATGLPVAAGPVEATVIGNILGQAMGRGLVRSAAEIRQIVRRSTEMTEYSPRDAEFWSERAARYLSLIDGSLKQ